MRKTLISAAGAEASPQLEDHWLKLESIARVEVTSEHRDFPVEGALMPNGAGWRAGDPGLQRIRLIFDEPISLRRIHLEFRETERERTQEFALRAASTPEGPYTEIVRQQWNFGPGATTEVEDYDVALRDVRGLELTLQPDLGSQEITASLMRWQLA